MSQPHSAPWDLGAIDPADRQIWRLHRREGLAIADLARKFGEPAAAISQRIRAYEAATDFTAALEARTIPFDPARMEKHA